MDRMRTRRSRFVPSGEGLEGRELLSTATAQAHTSTAAEVARQQKAERDAANALQLQQQTQQILEQRIRRVVNLPLFLQSIAPRAEIPRVPIQRIQFDLLTIIGQLRTPSQASVTQFNQALRNAVPNSSISAESAAQLSRTFGNVLKSAQAPAATIASLQASMNELVQADSAQTKPVILATNDYALVLQTALGIGRPIQSELRRLQAASRTPTVNNQGLFNRQGAFNR